MCLYSRILTFNPKIGKQLSATTVISAKNLTKHYRDFVAVDGINFSINQGECFGFLGPNGAGKTTIMKMISCVSPVTGGELLVNGKDVRHNGRDIKKMLGVVSQADSLDSGLNVLQNLMAFTRYFNLPKKIAIARVWEALEMFQLTEKAYQNPDELSGGMRRRLLIGRSLLHDPQILVLDEPTTGLDPQARLMLWEKLVYLKSQGITILLTTHYMEEAAYLCDRLVVMDLGHILVEGSPEDLIESEVGNQVVEIRVRLSEKPRLMEALQNHPIEVEDRGDSVLLYGMNGATSLDGLDGFHITTRPGNLEDVFLRLTGRGLREG